MNIFPLQAMHQAYMVSMSALTMATTNFLIRLKENKNEQSHHKVM